RISRWLNATVENSSKPELCGAWRGFFEVLIDNLGGGIQRYFPALELSGWSDLANVAVGFGSLSTTAPDISVDVYRRIWWRR
ncbi:hypothetical protein BaRGS_00028042, partial [Batillaria attramentaria]